MKYHELERKLRKIGRFPTGKNQKGHPMWYSPVTEKVFPMSHHHSQEVATGTLIPVRRDSGLDNYNEYGKTKNDSSY